MTINGNSRIGRNNHLFPNVVIGAEPQDLSYKGTPTQVIIGDGNVLRESVTINRATEKEDGITSVGNDCYFMTAATSLTTAKSVIASSWRTMSCWVDTCT